MGFSRSGSRPAAGKVRGLHDHRWVPCPVGRYRGGSRRDRGRVRRAARTARAGRGAPPALAQRPRGGPLGLRRGPVLRPGHAGGRGPVLRADADALAPGVGGVHGGDPAGPPGDRHGRLPRPGPLGRRGHARDHHRRAGVLGPGARLRGAAAAGRPPLRRLPTHPAPARHLEWERAGRPGVHPCLLWPAVLLAGERYDEVLFGMLREEWRA